eukprot:TRINITY_DN3845_c0_g2_i1.p1 TRINITY_DN3845_c0_g2~~TRINITY_DN3845_c0_g2_i1.p1  ORF type:complete len:131 (-),score=9.87 TRINITY_DN3845_c0_g2_i1:62-454(-)
MEPPSVSDDVLQVDAPDTLVDRVLEDPSLLSTIKFQRVPFKQPAKNKKARRKARADLVGKFVNYYWNSSDDTAGWYPALVTDTDPHDVGFRNVLLFADGSDTLARMIGYPKRSAARWELLSPVTSGTTPS